MNKYKDDLWFYKGITKEINLNKQILDSYKFLKIFFDIDRKQLDSMDLSYIAVLITTIINVLEISVTSKLVMFGKQDRDSNEETSGKSAFDEYDKENGYLLEDEEKAFNRWEELKKSIYAIFRYNMEICNGTYEGCYNNSLTQLIENTDFNIKNFNTSLKYKEMEIKSKSLL